MGSVLAEFAKLRRSLSWAVVVLLPVIMVVSGTAMTLLGSEPLDHGWHTLWLRSVVFYGLFPLAVGIGILASLVWRVEHRGGNWNALLSAPTRAVQIVAAKATVITTLAAAMQAVLLVSVVGIGKFAFGLPGILPLKYVGVSVLIVLAGLPVAVLQSGLSMLMRSFAAPIAITFLGAGLSDLLLLSEIDAAIFVLPYALIGHATQLGTEAFGNAAAITLADTTAVLAATAILTTALLAATTTILNRRDIHA